MARGVARRGIAVHRGRAEQVVALDPLRPQGRLDREQRAQRHHLPLAVADVERADVLRRGACAGLGLEHDPVDPPELVEVVDVIGAQVGREGLEQRVDRNAGRLDPLPVEVELELGHVGPEGREDRGGLRRAVGREDEAAQRLGQLAGAASLRVLQDELEAAGGAQTRDRRRVEGEDRRLRYREELRAHPRQDRVHVERRVLALRPVAELGDQEGRVRQHGARQQRVAADRHHRFHALGLHQDGFHLAHHGGGALEGRRVLEAHIDEEGAAILRGDETGRQLGHQFSGPEQQRGEGDHGDQHPADHQPHDLAVA